MKKQAQMVVFAVAAIGFLVTGGSAHTHQKTSDEKEVVLTKQERIFGLVTIYNAARQHFAYFEQVPELDWDKVLEEYLPKIQKEQTTKQQSFPCKERHFLEKRIITT